MLHFIPTLYCSVECNILQNMGKSENTPLGVQGI